MGILGPLASSAILCDDRGVFCPYCLLFIGLYVQHCDWAQSHDDWPSSFPSAGLYFHLFELWLLGLIHILWIASPHEPQILLPWWYELHTFRERNAIGWLLLSPAMPALASSHKISPTFLICPLLYRVRSPLTNLVSTHLSMSAIISLAWMQ